MKQRAMLSILISAVLLQMSSFAWHNIAMADYLPDLSIAQTVPVNRPMAGDCNILENGLGRSSTCSQIDCLTGHCSASPANVAVLANEALTPGRSFEPDVWFRLYEADRTPLFRPPVSV